MWLILEILGSSKQGRGINLQNTEMWSNNYSKTVGKWSDKKFLFGIIMIVFIFGFNFTARAYTTDSVSPNSTELKLDLNSVGKINEITLPVNDLINNAIKGLRFNQNINIGTGTPSSLIKSPSADIDFNKFFSSSKVSSNDLTSFLKEAAVTGINLTILVISITSQILKGILGAIK